MRLSVERTPQANVYLEPLRAIALHNLLIGYSPDLPRVELREDNNLTASELFDSAEQRYSPYADKFKAIGITPRDHVVMYSEAFAGNLRPVKEILEKSEKKMDRKQVKASLATENPVEMQARHARIVHELIKNVPAASEIGIEQKIIIVAGPFAGGKSEILKHKDLSNLVVIDLDIIRRMLSADYDPVDQRDIQRVREESWKLSDLLAMEALKQGKSVLMQTALHRRKRWLNDPCVNYAKERDIKIEIDMILRPVTECMNRNITRTRSTTMKDLYQSMNGMDVLIKFVQKFGNVSSVNLIDFYPMLKETQSFSPLAFEYQYRKLIQYAKRRPEIFNIYTRKSELEIYPD